MSDFLVFWTFSDSVKSPVTTALQRFHASTSVGSGDVAPCTSIDHQLEEWDIRLLLQELLEGCVTTMVCIVGIRIHSNQCAGIVQPADIDGSWKRGFIFGQGLQEGTVFQQQENGVCFVPPESCL